MSAQAKYETILFRMDEAGVAWCTFNRPQVRNALNKIMVAEIRSLMNSLAANPDVACLIFTGSEKAFVSGADIGELRERTRHDALQRINSDLFREIERFPAATIAAIRGYALGGGCELAMACDLRVCGERAKLGQPEVSLGIIPGAGATYRLPRLVGLGRARELIFTGRILGAGEALQIGLVNRVVPDEELLEAAGELASEIAANSKLAVRLAKLNLNQSNGANVDFGQAMESAAQAVLFEDHEKYQRMTAFLERKQAKKNAKSGPPLVPQLEVTGAVAKPLRLGFGELQAMPAGSQLPDVSTLFPKRKGSAVRLGALLERAQAKTEGLHVVVSSEGGHFSASLPTEVMQRALIVYALHGQPLTEDRGGPYRLLIPDHDDACANVKQVVRIEVQAEAGANKCAHSPEEHGR